MLDLHFMSIKRVERVFSDRMTLSLSDARGTNKLCHMIFEFDSMFTIMIYNDM